MKEKIKEIEEQEHQPEVKSYTLIDLIDTNLAFNRKGYQLVLDIGSNGTILSTGTYPKGSREENFSEPEESGEEFEFPKDKVIKGALESNKNYIS